MQFFVRSVSVFVPGQGIGTTSVFKDPTRSHDPDQSRLYHRDIENVAGPVVPELPGRSLEVRPQNRFINV